MDTSLYNSTLFDFLSSTPTPFHAVASMEKFLQQHDFTILKENHAWQLKQGHSYTVTRDNGAIIAFTLGKEETREQGFRVIAAHTDSPCLQIKPKPDIKKASYHQLGVEVYGGSLLAPWFDRDLSLAGRVCCMDKSGLLATLLVDFKRPLVTIPSIAIHLNRDANSAAEINKQQHLPPLIAQSIENQLPDFITLLQTQLKSEHPGSSHQDILSFDLFCYDSNGPLYTGVNGEFISGPRLDNLLSCHAGMTALVNSDRTKNSLLFCANHEENGSLSSSGAQGSFLTSVLERIVPENQTRQIALSNSFLISADNAHATHPNYIEKMDKEHEIHLNQGPVIKINANQRYTSNCLSEAIFKKICIETDIEPQEFVMRSDLACGSTIGPVTAAKLGIKAIDIGAPSLGMHSIRELTGRKDPFLLYRPLLTFLQSDCHRVLS